MDSQLLDTSQVFAGREARRESNVIRGLEAPGRGGARECRADLFDLEPVCAAVCGGGRGGLCEVAMVNCQLPSISQCSYNVEIVTE